MTTEKPINDTTVAEFLTHAIKLGGNYRVDKDGLLIDNITGKPVTVSDEKSQLRMYSYSAKEKDIILNPFAKKSTSVQRIDVFTEQLTFSVNRVFIRVVNTIIDNVIKAKDKSEKNSDIPMAITDIVSKFVKLSIDSKTKKEFLRVVNVRSAASVLSVAYNNKTRTSSLKCRLTTPTLRSTFTAEQVRKTTWDALEKIALFLLGVDKIDDLNKLDYRADIDSNYPEFESCLGVIIKIYRSLEKVATAFNIKIGDISEVEDNLSHINDYGKIAGWAFNTTTTVDKPTAIAATPTVQQPAYAVQQPVQPQRPINRFSALNSPYVQPGLGAVPQEQPMVQQQPQPYVVGYQPQMAYPIPQAQAMNQSQQQQTKYMTPAMQLQQIQRNNMGSMAPQQPTMFPQQNMGMLPQRTPMMLPVPQPGYMPQPQYVQNPQYQAMGYPQQNMGMLPQPQQVAQQYPVGYPQPNMVPVVQPMQQPVTINNAGIREYNDVPW